MMVIGSQPRGENYCHAFENVARTSICGVGDIHRMLMLTVGKVTSRFVGNLRGRSLTLVT